MQITSTSQIQGLLNSQQSASQNTPIQKKTTDTVSISSAAQALARSEVNENNIAESSEPTATQIKESEFVTAPIKTLNITV
ncbi:MAG: hypothetical protein R8K22_07375 [Mariprofundaceae bacterium]